MLLWPFLSSVLTSALKYLMVLIPGIANRSSIVAGLSPLGLASFDISTPNCVLSQPPTRFIVSISVYLFGFQSTRIV